MEIANYAVGSIVGLFGIGYLLINTTIDNFDRGTTPTQFLAAILAIVFWVLTIIFTMMYNPIGTFVCGILFFVAIYFNATE